MTNILYLTALIVIVIWAFGFLVYPFGGGLIHILLVIAIISILLGIIRRGDV